MHFSRAQPHPRALCVNTITYYLIPTSARSTNNHSLLALVIGEDFNVQSSADVAQTRDVLYQLYWCDNARAVEHPLRGASYLPLLLLLLLRVLRLLYNSRNYPPLC